MTDTHRKIKKKLDTSEHNSYLDSLAIVLLNGCWQMTEFAISTSWRFLVMYLAVFTRVTPAYGDQQGLHESNIIFYSQNQDQKNLNSHLNQYKGPYSFDNLEVYSDVYDPSKQDERKGPLR